MNDYTPPQPSQRGPRIPVAPPSERKLPWKPASMVRWLDPRQLAGTAVRSILADAFGEYADKRETQAALHPDVDPHDYTPATRPDLAGGMWLDYVADLGDGFDSTYAVAYALSRSYVERTGDGATLRDSGPRPGQEADAAGHAGRLRRGNVLVMGGDQVYPVPSRDLYEQRLVGPYHAAMSWDFAERPADLYAVPGNHDWYDGLTTFLRLFCTRADWVGGWRVPQRRSYFALQLPHRWWMLGVDIALTSRIDEPQLEYFERVARLEPGDRVILVTAQPSWVEFARGHHMGYENLVHFEERCIRRRGATVALTLTGDLHHYVRYTRQRPDVAASVDTRAPTPPDDRRHKIIAGGGGAYLYPTHHLDPVLRLPDPNEASGEAAYELADENVYPSIGYSRWRSVTAIWMVPFLNKWFVGFLGAVYGLFVWVLLSSVSAAGLATVDGQLTETLVARLTRYGPEEWRQALLACAQVLARSPASIFIAGVVIAGCIAFAKPEKVSRRPWVQRVRRALGAVIGTAHGVVHLTLATLGLWVTVRAATFAGQQSYPVLWNAATGVASLLVFGLCGAIVMGVYLAVTSLLPFVSLHWNESFSAQAIKDRKSFVRMHLDEDGTLRVYTVGIDKAPRRRLGGWTYHPGATDGAPWFTPTKPLALRIIDQVTLAAPRRPATAPEPQRAAEARPATVA